MVEEISRPEGTYGWQDLKRIMEILRSPEGCPWDREQSAQSLTPSLLEEAYEVLEEIEAGSKEGLCEELGDLLLQVFFQAQIAEEDEDFSLEEVVDGICRKLIRRHPHVFSSAEKNKGLNWSQIKARERDKEGCESILAAVYSRQPALMWAEEIQKKAAEVGFDWKDFRGAWSKFKEEVAEMESLLKSGTDNEDRLQEELGDLFFALVNVSRFLKLSPEMTLRQAVIKFINRFNYIEARVTEEEDDWEDLSLALLEDYWQEAKRELPK